uniref:Photosynthetic NDH subunit of lumenal location 3, chloroplastic n=1 Tax=Ananas comosus var. bracteatus TaxID=296719 RepID=A0A6V7QE72_ANACO|nr:unnamed protein product [Ananas comosus var. bracteatus]
MLLSFASSASPTSPMATSLSTINGSASQFSPAKLKQIKNHKPKYQSPQSYMLAQAQESHSLPSKSTITPHQVSRRASLSFSMALLLHQLHIEPSRADEGNGLWLTGPLPVPTVTNKIANEETGTRSFLRNGIYIANIGPQGSAFRLKHYAFDLLALGDMLGQETMSYFRKYLCMKSTVMYYDFDKVISTASDEQKQPLTDLANRLFDNVEKIEEAVKRQNNTMMQSCYADTVPILQEVMARMA